MKKFIQYLGVLLLGIAVVPSAAYAATFNTDPADFATFQVKNATRQGTSGGYSSSAVADPGETINLLVNLHNTANTAANNTRIFFNIAQGVAQSSFTANGGAVADNTAAVGNSVTLTINGGPQTLTYIPGSFKLFTTKASILSNSPTFAPINGQADTQALAASTASGMNIGTIQAAPAAPGDPFQYQTAITMQFRVGTTPTQVVAGNPTVSTNSVATASCTDATLSGFVNANGNSSVTTFFEYGTNSSLSGATQTGIQTFGNTSTNFTQFVSGLTQNTTYFFRANARGTNGVTVPASNIVSFSTNSCSSAVTSNPTVQTNPATNVGFTDATLNGFVNANGNSFVTTYFEYGPSFNPTQSRTSSVNFGNTSTSFSAFAGSLTPNTQYTFRAVAVGTNGQTVLGNPLTFTTGQNNFFNPVTPFNASVQTLQATGVSFDSAILNGLLNQNVSFPTTVWFEYGPATFGFNPAFGVPQNVTLPQQSLPQTLPFTPVSQQNFSRIVLGLSPNTTYFFRAVANVNGQVVRGNVLAFTTSFRAATPTVVTTTTVAPNGFSKVTITKAGANLAFPNGTKDCFAARPGDVVEYTITLKNTSASAAASNLTVRDTLSPYFEFLGASNGGRLEGTDVVWDLGTLSAGESRTVAFQVRVRSLPGNTNHENIATVSNGSSTKKSNSVNTILLNTASGTPTTAQLQGGAATGTSGETTGAIVETTQTNNTASSALSGFFPKTALGWLGLLILLILVALLVRALV